MDEAEAILEVVPVASTAGAPVEPHAAGAAAPAVGDGSLELEGLCFAGLFLGFSSSSS